LFILNKVPSLAMERQFSVKEAQASDELLTCIEEGSIEDVHRLLYNIPGGITSTLNTPSLLVKHKMRTPLMAAAATGDFARFTATLHAFDRQFPNKVALVFFLLYLSTYLLGVVLHKHIRVELPIPYDPSLAACPLLQNTQLQRDSEMRLQLTNRDREGMTAAMLAAKTSNVAVLGALLTEIRETEVRACCVVMFSRVMGGWLALAERKPIPVLGHGTAGRRAPRVVQGSRPPEILARSQLADVNLRVWKLFRPPPESSMLTVERMSRRRYAQAIERKHAKPLRKRGLAPTALAGRCCSAISPQPTRWRSHYPFPSPAACQNCWYIRAITRR